MLFNSLTFAVFFSAVLLLHNLPLSWTVKKGNLLFASYLFYAAWNPPFVVLLWISTLTDWFAARKMSEARSLGRRRLALLASMGCLPPYCFEAVTYCTWLQVPRNLASSLAYQMMSC